MNTSRPKATGLFEDDDQTEEPQQNSTKITSAKPTVKLQNLTTIVQSLDIKSTGDQESDNPPWLLEGLLVTCKNEQLASGNYRNRTGVVERLVEGGYGAEIRMTDSLDVLLLDQDDCTPTIPKEGLAKVLRGQYRAALGRMVEMQGRDDIVLEMIEPKSIAGRRLAFSKNDICSITK